MLMTKGIAEIIKKISTPAERYPEALIARPETRRPATRPKFKKPRNRPLDFVWSGRELAYDIAEAIKRPAPIPSINLASITRNAVELSRRRKPEIIVRRRPARIKYNGPQRSDKIPTGNVRRNAPRKYAE